MDLIGKSCMRTRISGGRRFRGQVNPWYVIPVRNLSNCQQPLARYKLLLKRLTEVSLIVLLGYGLFMFLITPLDGSVFAATPFSGFTAEAQPPAGSSLFEQFFGAQPEAATARATHFMRVVEAWFSFILAAVLAALLAFRPHKELSLFKRNPFIVQAQILLAVVGAALMMIVADNAARAFGIFASASLIRFRTNIRNPKEITVLLVSLAVGLASGVGRWEIAVSLTFFVLLILLPLERFELSQVFRAMELEVKTKNISLTDAALKKLFKRHNITAELREADAHKEKDESGVVLYFLNLSPDLSTDQLSQEIWQADGQNIDSVKWEQKNSRSYIYR